MHVLILLRTGNLDAVLANLKGKVKKQNVLDKSREDWEGFKVHSANSLLVHSADVRQSKTGIIEELRMASKTGKGYLDRMAFLQRTDVRQWEYELQFRKQRKPPASHPPVE